MHACMNGVVVGPLQLQGNNVAFVTSSMNTMEWIHTLDFEV